MGVLRHSVKLRTFRSGVYTSDVPQVSLDGRVYAGLFEMRTANLPFHYLNMDIETWYSKKLEDNWGDCRND
jgi:hypothetical protein